MKLGGPTQCLFALFTHKLNPNVIHGRPGAFVQGDANRQFPLADVQAFCTQHPNLQATAAPGAAQLTLVTHGELIVQVLRGLAPV